MNVLHYTTETQIITNYHQNKFYPWYYECVIINVTQKNYDKSTYKFPLGYYECGTLHVIQKNYSNATDKFYPGYYQKYFMKVTE